MNEQSISHWTCLLCGRNKFARPGQPHRCGGQYRKRFNRSAKQLGFDKPFVPSISIEQKSKNDNLLCGGPELWVVGGHGDSITLSTYDSVMSCVSNLLTIGCRTITIERQGEPC